MRFLARDGQIPVWLRWLVVLGLLPVPGPFDEALLLLAAVILWLFYPDRMRKAWSHAGEAAVLQTPDGTSLAGAARRHGRFVLAVATLALASAFVMEAVGPNQTAHLAATRALAAGRPWVHAAETGDDSFVHGHYYAAKAPGLAMYSLPSYEVLRGVGLVSGSERSVVWKLNLFGAVLPFAVLLLLIRSAVERVVPRYGSATAVLVGAGTLLFPFSALLFDHMLSATLGFAAFLALMVERRGARERRWLVAAAGLLAGLAVVVEFPLVIVAVGLGLVFLLEARRLARLALYAVTVVIGLTPLLLFNTWAFGSPTAISYANALGGNNKVGLFGVQLPDPRTALTLLLSGRGLFVITPVLALAAAGLPRLWRVARRREALACTAIPLAFLLWNAGYYIPFGGSSPGPRFLVPILPFLALPLALMLRARPLLVGGLGVLSGTLMWLATATAPLSDPDRGIRLWLHLLGKASFMNTVLSPGVSHDWLEITPSALAFLAALAIGFSALPSWKPAPGEPLLLLAALGSWLIVAIVVSPFLPIQAGAGTPEGALTVLVLAGALGAGLYLADRRGMRALVPLLPLLLLAAPHMTAHPRWSLLLTVLTLGLAVSLWTGGPRAAVRRLLDPRQRPKQSEKPSRDQRLMTRPVKFVGKVSWPSGTWNKEYASCSMQAG